MEEDLQEKYPQVWSEEIETPQEESALDMSIEDFLRGSVSYDIPDNAMLRVLVKRQVAAGTMVSTLTEKILDLSTADIYLWCASTPSSKSSTKDSDGDWSHEEGGWETSAYDKRQLREMAKALYDKWDEPWGATSKMVIVNF